MKRLIDYFLHKFFHQFARENYSFAEKALIQKKRMTQTREEILAEMAQTIDEFERVRAKEGEVNELIDNMRELIEKQSAEQVNQEQLKELEEINKRFNKVMSKLRGNHAIHA